MLPSPFINNYGIVSHIREKIFKKFLFSYFLSKIPTYNKNNLKNRRDIFKLKVVDNRR